MELQLKITEDQSRSAGMALVLVCLLVFAFREREAFLLAAIALLVVNMIAPQVYKPVAFLWSGLSELLGAVSSRALLTISFFLVVVPIGVLRRLLGKDSLRLKGFKQGQDSVMAVRDHKFVAQDIDRPF